jgi:hypothetical protein
MMGKLDCVVIDVSMVDLSNALDRYEIDMAPPLAEPDERSTSHSV